MAGQTPGRVTRQQQALIDAQAQAQIDAQVRAQNSGQLTQAQLDHQQRIHEDQVRQERRAANSAAMLERNNQIMAQERQRRATAQQTIDMLNASNVRPMTAYSPNEQHYDINPQNPQQQFRYGQYPQDALQHNQPVYPNTRGDMSLIPVVLRVGQHALGYTTVSPAQQRSQPPILTANVPSAQPFGQVIVHNQKFSSPDILFRYWMSLPTAGERVQFMQDWHRVHEQINTLSDSWPGQVWERLLQHPQCEAILNELRQGAPESFNGLAAIVKRSKSTTTTVEKTEAKIIRAIGDDYLRFYFGHNLGKTFVETLWKYIQQLRAIGTRPEFVDYHRYISEAMANRVL